MTLLNPLLLLGVLAVAVPVAIHLRSTRQLRRVWWGAMRFLQAAIERHQRRRRLEDRLLLLVRCLAVVLLALLLARPAWTGPGGCVGAGGSPAGGGPVTAVLVVDVSGSMQTGDGVRSRLEHAREAALSYLDALPTGSRVALWTAGADVRKLVPEPTADLRLVRRLLGDLEATELPSDLLPSVRDALAALSRREGQSLELLVLTDGQRRAFSDLPAMGRALQARRADVAATFVLVGEDESANLALCELTTASELAVVGRSVRFVARVTNHGQTPVREVRVVLRRSAEAVLDAGPRASRGDEGGPGAWAGFADDVADEAVLDELPAGATRAVSLVARFRRPGLYGLTAEIADAVAVDDVGSGNAPGDASRAAVTGPGDRVRFDDRRSVVVRVVPGYRVLLVEGSPAADPRDDESFFLSRLWPGHDDAGRGAEVSAAATWVQSVRVAGSEIGRVRLDDYDAVVVCGGGALPASVASRLAAFVRGGGGLILFPPGGRPDGANAPDLWQSLARLGVLPVARVWAAEGEVSFAALRSDHPVAAAWGPGDTADFGSVVARRAFRLEPEPWARPVLAWSDQTAAVVEGDVGDGRVLVYGVAATTQAGDLPLRPAVFVPLAYRSLAWVTGGQAVAGRLNLRVGDTFALPLPAGVIVSPADEAADLAVVERLLPRDSARGVKAAVPADDPRDAWRDHRDDSPVPGRGVWLAAGVAELTAPAADLQRELRFSLTHREGIYRVRLSEAVVAARADVAEVPGGVAAAPTQRHLTVGATGLFATVPDPGESELPRLTAEQKAALAEHATVTDAANWLKRSAAAGAARPGEWFGFLATLLLAVATCEALMAWRFSQPR